MTRIPTRRRHLVLLLSKRESRTRKVALHDTGVPLLLSHSRYLRAVTKKRANELTSGTDATKAIAAVKSTLSPCNTTMPTPTNDFTNKATTTTTRASATRNIFSDEMSAASSCLPSVWDGAVIISAPPPLPSQAHPPLQNASRHHAGIEPAPHHQGHTQRSRERVDHFRLSVD